MLLSCAILGAGYFQIALQQTNPLEIMEDQVVTIYGQVESLDAGDGQFRIIIDAEKWKQLPEEGLLNGKVLVYLGIPTNQGYLPEGIDSPADLVGKELSIKGRVSLPSESRNPGLFNYKQYLKTRKIHSIINASVYQISVVGEGNPISCQLAGLKQKFASSLDGRMDVNEKALLQGMLFGDRSLLEDDLYEAFQRNGTAHILAVSGIHVGILYAYTTKLLRNRKNLLTSLIVLGFLFLYAALASFSPSVMRAVTMISLHILSGHLHRRYDLESSAAFSAILMLLYNPWNLFNLGFQLSYLAVFTLAFLQPMAQSMIENQSTSFRVGMLASLIRAMIPVIAIQIGLMPITAYLFQYVSIAAFFLNLPVILLAGLVIPLGMISLFLCVIGGDIFDLTATGLDLLLRVMIHLNVQASNLDLASFLVQSPSIGALVLYYGLLFFLSSELFWSLVRGKSRSAIVTVVLWICIFTVSIYLWSGEGRAKATLTFVDVGQGDCIHLRTPSGKNILIDGGGKMDYDVGKEILAPYLLKNGVSNIDMVLVTHLHEDHFGGIISLCHLLPINRLALFEGNLLRQVEVVSETGIRPDQLVYLSKGDRIQLEDEIFIEILWPEEGNEETYKELLSDKSDENDSCLLVKIHYYETTVLVTGDIGIDVEKSLVEDYGYGEDSALRADILKVGHHGSKYATGDEFLQAVDPRIAVIQVGRNNFGHPHADIIEKLEKSGIITYRNDQQGAILIWIEPEKVKVRTMLPGEEGISRE